MMQKKDARLTKESFSLARRGCTDLLNRPLHHSRGQELAKKPQEVTHVCACSLCMCVYAFVPMHGHALASPDWQAGGLWDVLT